jgi:phospho-N-acetylmuramoyl-pentapeptide-transferase
MIDTFSVVKVLIIATVAFLLAMSFTPLVTRILYTYKIGKRLRDKEDAPIFRALHEKKLGTPTMGGVVVWFPVLVLAVALNLLSKWMPETWSLAQAISRLDFLSRAQTLLPLGALVASAAVGLFDDYLNARGIGKFGGGIRFRHRLIMYAIISAVGAWWFAVKLDWDILHVPFLGDFNIGLWYALVFVIVVIGTSFSVNQTDGLDGLAGGTLLTSFGAYGAISLMLGREDLATLCAAITGALLAFLWFNINPARFFMGDTGSMSLGVTIAIISMLTNQVLLLPVIGLVFVIEAFSTLIQLASKTIFSRKFFRSSPIHHHLEAVGWPEPKVVMRAWVISMIVAALGVALAVLDIGTVSIL